jgi:hypothetical protein
MSLLKIGEIKNKPTMIGESSNPYYVFSDSLDTNLYYDITSNVNWFKIGMSNYDYLFCRNQVMVRTAVIGFSALTTDEKKIAAKHYSVGTTERAEVFSDGENQDNWALFVENAHKCREKRWNLGKSYISYVLPTLDSIDMAEKTDTLSHNYIVYGIEEKSVDGATGLFDWVENTADYSGGTGFSGQTYWTQEYQDNLSSILRNGYK